MRPRRNHRSVAMTGLVVALSLLTMFASAGTASANPRIYPFLPELSQAGAACGATTDSHGDLYVATFLTNTVKVYSPSGAFITQFSASSPCGLAVDSTGNVYVNSLDTALVKYSPSGGDFPPTPSTTYAPDTSVNGTGTVVNPSTDVAVNPANQNVYVSRPRLNETQAVSRNGATGGSYKLCKGDAPTVCSTPIAFNGNAAAVTNALTPLYGAGNVTTTGLGANPRTVFFQGALVGTPMPLLVCDGTALTGGPSPGTCTPSRTVGGSPSRVAIFQPDGTNLSNTIGTDVPGASYYGVGVYGANGDVYATNGTEAYVFDGGDGHIKQTITGGGAPDGAFTASSRRSLAVDQSNGHVRISDIQAHGVVDEFDASGTYIAQIGPGFGDGLTIQDSNPSDVAVDNGPSSPNQGVTYVTSGGSAAGVYAFGPSVEAPDASATVTAAVDVTATTATLTGAVTDNSAAPTEWRLEISREGTTWKEVASGRTDGGEVNTPVSGDVTGLRANTLYRYRVVTNKGPGSTDIASGEGTFLTDAVEPLIVGTSADSVEQRSVRLVGYVNPNSTPTSYRFEWGTASGVYPNRVPMPNASLGSGPSLVQAAQVIDGLEPATTYYFRLVATSSTEGSVAGPERTVTTRSAPVASRGIEMVSPPDKGGAGRTLPVLSTQMAFQAAPSGDSVFYPIGYGLPDATVGTDVGYRANRGSVGWTSAQLGPPQLGESGPGSPGAWSGRHLFLADDLSCGVFVNGLKLTPDTPTVPLENDGGNLFTFDSAGAYRAVTAMPPTNAGDPLVKQVVSNEVSAGYVAAGVTQDCKHVVFTTLYRYAGLNASGLYRWDDGAISDVGVMPDGSTAANLELGAAGQSGVQWRAVSADTSRTYFSATSNSGPDLGKRALYLRDGSTTTKVSASETATVTQDAYYQTASTDGSRVAFLSNYGLTSISSSGPTATNCQSAIPQPCALYVYDADSGELTDLSATSDAANVNGATVAGVVAASDDLSRVYFAAQAQLVAGEGKTYAQNVADDTYSVYLSDGGELSYVAPATKDDLIGKSVDAGKAGGMLMRAGIYEWVAQSTPDGSHLLFPSEENVVGYDSGGVTEAYLYSAASGESTCLSCRRDGEPSVGDAKTAPLGNWSVSKLQPSNRMSHDAKRVFFTMPDALTPDAVNGKSNVYVWDEGALRLLTTADLLTPDAEDDGGEGRRDAFIYGVTPSGDDVFVSTPKPLDPRDNDGAQDLYDFRIGGGFAAPAPEVECAPLAGSCQGGPAGAPEQSSPSSNAFDGPGNAEPGVTTPTKRCVTAQRQLKRLTSRTRQLQRTLRSLRAQRRGTSKRARQVKTRLRSSRKASIRTRQQLAGCNGGGK